MESQHVFTMFEQFNEARYAEESQKHLIN